MDRDGAVGRDGAAEAGALNYLNGDITIKARLPSPWSAVKSAFASESLVRPAYSGTGAIQLEGALGGFHVLNLHDKSWILQRGSYWASDGEINVSAYREKILTALWTGEGFVLYNTKVSGSGQVVVRTNGPAEEIVIQSGRYLAESNIVIGRTGYTLKRPTRSYIGYLLSGEQYLHCYEGTGRLLVCSTPYWRMQFQKNMRRR